MVARRPPNETDAEAAPRATRFRRLRDTVDAAIAATEAGRRKRPKGVEPPPPAPKPARAEEPRGQGRAAQGGGAQGRAAQGGGAQSRAAQGGGAQGRAAQGGGAQGRAARGAGEDRRGAVDAPRGPSMDGPRPFPPAEQEQRRPPFRADDRRGPPFRGDDRRGPPRADERRGPPFRGDGARQEYPRGPVPKARGQRRALSHVGGAIELDGADPRLLELVERALTVTPDERDIMAHVHGFHSYPARLHPATARGLVHALAPAHGTVLDPFCGSGTVVVEARLSGRVALGVDANPLAVDLARLKVTPIGASEAEMLTELALVVADHAEDRRKKRAGATRHFDDTEMESFEPHVLLELDGIRDGIEKHAADMPDARRTLLLVLSALLTKLSRRRGDSSEGVDAKRIAAGYPTKLFRKKLEELLVRLRDFQRLLPGGAPPAKLLLGDARVLAGIDDGTVDLIVSSPPYAGVYDYHAHHAMRLRWLGHDTQGFEQAEIGSRRRLQPLDFATALGRWEKDLGAALGAMARVLKPGGRSVLVMADSVLARRPVWADEGLRRLAPKHGLTVEARASQPRPHFHAPTAHAFEERERKEHVVVLQRPNAV